MDTRIMSLGSDSLALRPAAPTSWPMAAPWPALVAVTDTNALMQRACDAVLEGQGKNVFLGLTTTGRSNTYVAAHVPGELGRHLPTIAAKAGVQVNDAVQMLLTGVMPAIPVVDLAIRDFLHPRIRPILNVDPALPKKLRGDPDDVATAALAEFLAPAIVLSQDTVFERLGISSVAAVAYVETARKLMHMAGIEATLADTVALVDLAIRAIGFLGAQTIQGLRQHPYIGIAIGGAVLCLVYRLGYLRRDRLREGLRQLGEWSGPILEATALAVNERHLGRQALTAVEPYGTPTIDQSAARHLARCGRQLTPRELRDQLRLEGREIPAAALKRAMRSHPAFVRTSGDFYGVGRPMTWDWSPEPA
jgi:hypothetical protein